MDESELVVHGVRAMLEPHSTYVTVVPQRSEGVAPLCDLTLYEPSVHRRTTGVRPMPQRFPTRMVAFGWDCSPEAMSTEMARGAAGFLSKWLPARRLVRNLLLISEGRVVVDAWTGKAEASRPMNRTSRDADGGAGRGPGSAVKCALTTRRSAGTPISTRRSAMKADGATKRSIRSSVLRRRVDMISTAMTADKTLDPR